MELLLFSSSLAYWSALSQSRTLIRLLTVLPAPNIMNFRIRWSLSSKLPTISLTISSLLMLNSVQLISQFSLHLSDDNVVCKAHEGLVGCPPCFDPQLIRGIEISHYHSNEVLGQGIMVIRFVKLSSISSVWLGGQYHTPTAMSFHPSPS